MRSGLWRDIAPRRASEDEGGYIYLLCDPTATPRERRKDTPRKARTRAVAVPFAVTRACATPAMFDALTHARGTSTVSIRRDARERETPEVEAEETCAMRAARKVYDERMERVRRVTRRRATTLARAATVVVDPETCKVMGRLNAEELRVLLKLDSKKQAFVDEKRRANAQTPLKGPMLGDIYRMPRLYEEVWLFKDSDTGVPTASELIHMMVRM